VYVETVLVRLKCEQVDFVSAAESLC